MNAILGGILFVASLFPVVGILNGEQCLVAVCCVVVAFVSGIVTAAYSNWHMEEK